MFWELDARPVALRLVPLINLNNLTILISFFFCMQQVQLAKLFVMFRHKFKLTFINTIMMVRTRALIILLLLRSGDVELNPGPMSEEGGILNYDCNSRYGACTI